MERPKPEEKVARYSPCIVILAGPPLTGKTTTGEEIERKRSCKRHNDFS